MDHLQNTGARVAACLPGRLIPRNAGPALPSLRHNALPIGWTTGFANHTTSLPERIPYRFIGQLSDATYEDTLIQATKNRFRAWLTPKGYTQ
jgi:hypothetical protein